SASSRREAPKNSVRPCRSRPRQLRRKPHTDVTSARARRVGEKVMSNFVVTNLNDGGAGSLRNALALANANPDADTITFDPSLAGGARLLAQGQGQLAISTDVTVDAGTAGITISADSAAGAHDATSRVFRVDDGTGGTISAALNGLTIRDGHENTF